MDALKKALELFIDWLPFPSYTKQVPIRDLSPDEIRLAFRFAPDYEREFRRRGTISRNEFIKLQNINLNRIQEEIRSRGLKGNCK